MRGRGFTLFEVTLVLMIIGIVAVAILPAAGGSLRAGRLRTAANVLASDIEFCASTCISRPSAPAAITFAQNQYTMIDVKSAATMTHPADGQPYLNDFATGRNAQLADVTIAGVMVGNTPVTVLTFDAYGKPSLTGNLVITLAYKSQSLTVTVSASTGDVTISG